MRYISRSEHGAVGTHYWKVTIQRQKRNYIRNFADQRHGGKDQALAAAQAYRDALLADHPLLSRRERCAIVKTHNRSGRAGCHAPIEASHSVGLLGRAMARGRSDREAMQVFRPEIWGHRCVPQGRRGETAWIGDDGGVSATSRSTSV